MLTADSNVVASVPGIENIRNPGAFETANVEPVEPAGPPTTVGESIRQTYDESVLADLIGRGFGQEAFQSQAPDGTPTFSIFNKRFGTLGSQVPYSEASPEAKAQAMRFMLETGGIERPLPETPTSPVRTPEQVQSILNEQRATESVQSPTATAQSFFGQAPASNAAEAAQRLIDAGPTFTQAQAPAQAPELDPNSDEAILARRAAREAQFAPRRPMGPEETRARLGGMTLNEYLNAPAGTPGVSGLRTDPQGRMITTPAPAAVNNFAPQVTGRGNAVGLPILESSPVPMPGTRPGDAMGSNPVPMPGTRPGDRNPFQGDPGFIQQPSLREPDAGFTPRPLPNDPASTRPGNVRDMLYREPVPNLSDFERESLAREARIAERDRLPGETQTERDTRIARSRTQRSSRGGLSQADARDLAQGMARGATEGERARALQIQSRLGLGQFEPERELTDLEKREIESRISAREADIARSETKADFQPRLIDVGGERAMELSPGYFQRIPKDTPNKTGLQKTLENLQADLDSGRLTQEEYDIATKNARDLYIGREEPKPAKPEETSGLIDMDGETPVATETAPTVPNDIKDYPSVEAAEAANLAVGTRITVQGKPAIIE
jgi:hypothetical protein